MLPDFSARIRLFLSEFRAVDKVNLNTTCRSAFQRCRDLWLKNRHLSALTKPRLVMIGSFGLREVREAASRGEQQGILDLDDGLTGAGWTHLGLVFRRQPRLVCIGISY